MLNCSDPEREVYRIRAAQISQARIAIIEQVMP